MQTGWKFAILDCFQKLKFPNNSIIKQEKEMKENKSLMDLYGDYLFILAHSAVKASLNTLSEITVKNNFRLKDENNITTWTKIYEQIDNYTEELKHYRENTTNPLACHGLELDKLVKYKKHTISCLRVIRRHALYADSKNNQILNKAADDLKNTCNLLLELIRDELEDTNIGKQTNFIELYE